MHDLSLVTDSALPRMTIPQGHPKIIGWAEYTDFLDGKPLYMTSMHIESRKPTITGRTVKNTARIAIGEGVQYMWNRDAVKQSASLLWRTEYDYENVTG